ncbi:MAG: hypothetical protein ACHREM_12940 [Polyangiales bacterium]
MANTSTHLARTSRKLVVAVFVAATAAVGLLGVEGGAAARGHHASHRGAHVAHVHPAPHAWSPRYWGPRFFGPRYPWGVRVPVGYEYVWVDDGWVLAPEGFYWEPAWGFQIGPHWYGHRGHWVRR